MGTYFYGFYGLEKLRAPRQIMTCRGGLLLVTHVLTFKAKATWGPGSPRPPGMTRVLNRLAALGRIETGVVSLSGAIYEWSGHRR